MSYTNDLNKSADNFFFLMNVFRHGLSSLDFKSLTEWRVEYDVTFVYKVLNSVIDAAYLLSKISLAVLLKISSNFQN